MPQKPDTHSKQNLQAQKEYRKNIFNHFETMMRSSRKIIASGFDEYRKENTNESYAVDSYIKTSEKIILIVTDLAKQLSGTDIETIMCESFRPISEDEDIIAIIDCSHGYESQAISAICTESYPIVLTQQTKLISTNLSLKEVDNGLKIINELFFQARNNLPQPVLLDEHRYEDVAFIMDGGVRREVYLSLCDHHSYGARIAKEKGLYKESVYRAIQALVEEGIVECRNLCSKRRKYYQLTAQGTKIKEEIKKLSENEH